VFKKLALLQKKKEALSFVLNTYLPGQMIGEEDALQERAHATSVKCISESC